MIPEVGFPPTAILSTLPMIAQLGVCGDVINFGAVNLSQLVSAWHQNRTKIIQVFSLVTGQE